MKEFNEEEKKLLEKFNDLKEKYPNIYKKIKSYLIGLTAVPIIIWLLYFIGDCGFVLIKTSFTVGDAIGAYVTLLGAIATIVAVVSTILYTTNSEIDRRNYDADNKEKEKKIKEFEEKIILLVEYINPRLFMGFSSYSEYDTPINFKESINHYNVFRYHLSTVKLYFEVNQVDAKITDYFQDIVSEDTKILKAFEDRECVVKELNYLYVNDKTNEQRITILVETLKKYDVFFNKLYETDYDVIINNTRDLIAHYKKKIMEEK